MKLNPVPPHVAKAGLRALHSVFANSSEGEMSDLQSRFIQGVQKQILNSDIAPDSLQKISPQELAQEVTETEFRNRLIRACVIAGCIDGEMDTESVKRIEQYARALGVDMAPVHTAWKLAHKNLLLARMDIIRKSLPGVKIRQTIRSEGWFAVIKQFFPLIGVETPEVTARYKELENYPEGTLGREYIKYLRANHFPFPGEKGAGPEIIVLHDCLHILGDYGTSAPEEIEVASFQAGCQFQDPVYGMLFGLAQYHMNIQVAPVAPSQSLQANPEKILAAFARGCRVNRDMWTDFKPWEHFDKSIDELRMSLNIGPK